MLDFKVDSLKPFYANWKAKRGYRKLHWNHAGAFNDFPFISAKEIGRNIYPRRKAIELVLALGNGLHKEKTLYFFG